MKSKRSQQLKHAVNRAYLRYEVNITETDIAKMCRMIQAHERCTLIEKQSNRVSIYKLNYNEQEMMAVYDRLRNVIVSFLPLDWQRHDNRKYNFWESI